MLRRNPDLSPRLSRLFAKRGFTPLFTQTPTFISLSLLGSALIFAPFFALINRFDLLGYYAIFPPLVILAFIFHLKGRTYLSSLLLVLSTYAVYVWFSWLLHFSHYLILHWVVVAVMPFVIFSLSRWKTIGILSLSAISMLVIFSWLRKNTQSSLFEGEQARLFDLLTLVTGLGAFMFVFFLKRDYEGKYRQLNEEQSFFQQMFDSIPLPIIIKDGITLEYLYYNTAAELTFGIPHGDKITNNDVFISLSASSISQLDRQTLLKGGTSLQQEEIMVMKDGLQWTFRSYRLPLTVSFLKRTFLLHMTEDLHASTFNQKKQARLDALNLVFEKFPLLVFKIDFAKDQIEFLTQSSQLLRLPDVSPDQLRSSLQNQLAPLKKSAPLAKYRDVIILGDRVLDLSLAASNESHIFIGILIEQNIA